MNEPYEMRVIIKCPECGAYHYNWIAYNPTLPFTLEELCGDCEELVHEFERDLLDSKQENEITIKKK